MGCGMSKSNLMDEGMSLHGKTDSNSSKMQNKEKDPPEPLILHHPPALQKINTIDKPNHHHKHVSDVDPVVYGSPSFREYIQSTSNDDAPGITGNEHGEETVNGTQGGQNLTCNEEVCGWGDSKGKEHTEKKESRVARFRKVFQVHKATFWHGRAWHAGQQKGTRKSA